MYVNQTTHIPRAFRRGMRYAGWIVAAEFAVFQPGGAAAEPTPPVPRNLRVAGITVPNETATLASVQAARIECMSVPEGGTVRKGEIVVNLEERTQAARTEIAKAAATTMLPVDNARVRWEYARRELDRLLKLRGDDFASSKEMSDVVAGEQIARIEYDLANFNQGQAAWAHERERAALEDFRLRAPFDGVVVAHLKHNGETVNEMEGIITLVQLNPLKVVMDCPVDAISAVRVGDRFRVEPIDSGRVPREGTVVFASQAADSGSQTFKVKLSVDNADVAWFSGMKVVVDFSEPTPVGQADAR